MFNNLLEENKNLDTKETENKEELKDSSQDSSQKSGSFLKKKKKINQKKICMLCKRGILHVDYKNINLLKNYLKKNNKIVSHKMSGNCLKHQHQVQNSIKRARILALLPFVVE